ncbi:MAG: VpsF family polysaccharide biosynthesis protein [Alphaproteobacteria bacterium]|nr:VpsF family polysaccharide biosynthesis protein [Alphaproteobacteria bacterium]
MSPAIAYPPIIPPKGRLFDVGLIAVLVLFLAVSPLMLDMFGWHYGAPGGSALEKIHPATWMLFAVLFLSASARGNPLSTVIDAAHRYPGVFIYVTAVLVLIAQAILILHQPFTVYIDTFLAPAAVFLLLHRLPEHRGRRLALLIHALFFINAVIGIAEFVFGFRVTPFVIEGVEFGTEWRSSALFGHPLSNALMMGCYVLSLALGAGREMPLVVRLCVFAVAALSMAVFGGRAATVVLIVLIALLALKKLFSILAGKSFDLRSVWFVLLCLPVVLAGFAVIYDVGFFDRFLGRIFDDAGSAGTRLAMFSLFRHLSWYDLLVGPDPSHLKTYTTIYGLELGIESFWIAMIMVNGLIVALPFFATLIVFCHAVSKAAQRAPAVWVFVSFFAVASASLSLSAKTPDFAILVAVILILFRKPWQETTDYVLQPTLSAQLALR